MNKTATILAIALAVLAATPAFGRARHHVRTHQARSWTQQQVAPGYYDAAKVRPGDVPFAPFGR